MGNAYAFIQGANKRPCRAIALTHPAARDSTAAFAAAMTHGYAGR